MGVHHAQRARSGDHDRPGEPGADAGGQLVAPDGDQGRHRGRRHDRAHHAEEAGDPDEGQELRRHVCGRVAEQVGHEGLGRRVVARRILGEAVLGAVRRRRQVPDQDAVVPRHVDERMGRVVPLQAPVGEGGPAIGGEHHVRQVRGRERGHARHRHQIGNVDARQQTPLRPLADDAGDPVAQRATDDGRDQVAVRHRWARHHQIRTTPTGSAPCAHPGRQAVRGDRQRADHQQPDQHHARQHARGGQRLDDGADRELRRR